VTPTEYAQLPRTRKTRANNADVQHFLGLLLVRQRDCGGALDRLRRANDRNVEITGRDLGG
jgi:hypothetical protein